MGLGAEWEEYRRLKKERPQLFKQGPDMEIIRDECVVNDFQEKTGRTIGVVYRSPFNTMVVDLVRDVKGNVFPYERLFGTSTGEGVVSVPTCNGRLVLLRQFRHAMRDYQYAFPRGFGEDGLSAAENVTKELAEELGATISSLEIIGHVVANSGISGDRVAVVRCELSDYSAQYGYEGIADVVSLTEDEFARWISEGRIDDGFTLAAWALLSTKQRAAR